jgi:predicted aspartyl protease
MQIKPQQLLLSALAISATLSGTLLPMAPTQANDQSGCFMVDEAGRTISLGKLCGYGAPSGNSKPSSSKPGNAAASSANNGANSGAKNGVVQVPILRRAGMTPVIAVSFNDSQTYEMILDTGASGTLVTRAMANSLKLKQTGVITASIADGSTVKFPTGRVSSIAVAGAKVKNVDVAIADDMDIGLLGHDFFGNYDIRIGKDVVEFSPR